MTYRFSDAGSSLPTSYARAGLPAEAGNLSVSVHLMSAQLVAAESLAGMIESGGNS